MFKHILSIHVGMIENALQHLQSTRRELGHDTEHIDHYKKSAHAVVCRYNSFVERHFEIHSFRNIQNEVVENACVNDGMDLKVSSKAE